MIRAYLKGEQNDWNLHLGCLTSAYRYLVKQSMTVMMLLFPLGVLGNGPTISVVTQSSGLPTGMEPKGAFGFLLVTLDDKGLLERRTK
jgi:hypothetical protein